MYIYLYILKENGHKGHLFKHCALDKVYNMIRYIVHLIGFTT